MTPKISVLVPVYNTREDHLREALDSILAQTFTDFELLIVNDASTDPNVERVVRSYADTRIRYFANEKNLGISGTRNRLIDLSQGEYLAVMDHDDISLPERFAKEAAYLDAHPDVGVVSCAAEYFGEQRHVAHYPMEDRSIRFSLMHYCSIAHSASMIRKSVLLDNNIRYEQIFSPAEDYALWCRLIPHTQFHNLPEILFRYRYHSDNTTSRQKDKMERATRAVWNFVKTDYPALYSEYMETAIHTTKYKLFGCIPFLKIITRGRRQTCWLFGVLPLYRSKIDHRLPEA